MRSSLADAAWAVEDRVVWGTAELLRGLLDTVKWPFQRVAWAAENWLIWPIQEETALWSRPVRAAVLGAVIVLAAAGVAAGVIASDPSGSGSGAVAAREVAAPVSKAPPTAAPKTPAAGAAVVAGGPVLHGSQPDFVPESGGGVSKAEAAGEPAAAQAAAGSDAAAGAKPESGAAVRADAPGGEVAGPGAIKVARSFAGAFVLYETGRDNARVRTAFHRTATPDLAKALLKRPPRLPANVKVPKAKVLNIVAGPGHGDTYTLSVSLLRVGVTSELKLDMKKTAGKRKASGGAPADAADGSRWLVTDVLG